MTDPTADAAKLLPCHKPTDAEIWESYARGFLNGDAPDYFKIDGQIVQGMSRHMLSLAEKLAEQNTRPQPAPPEGEPIARVEETPGGPRLWIAGILVAHELGCEHDAEFHKTAAILNDRLGQASRPKVEDAPTTKHDEAMALACIHTWDQNPLADHVGIDGPLLKQVAKLFLSTASKLAEREAELAKARDALADAYDGCSGDYLKEAAGEFYGVVKIAIDESDTRQQATKEKP